MEKENAFPKRKRNRWEHHDYSNEGMYFITICTDGRKPILSEILPVGDGAHDVPNIPARDGIYDVAHIRLTEVGRIAKKYLLSSEKIKGIKIDQYVIMPNHIHAIILVEPEDENNGSSRAPTPTNAKIPHLISTFKRLCHQKIGEKIFQRSFHDRVIRNREEYLKIQKYIYENPNQWSTDELFVED